MIVSKDRLFIINLCRNLTASVDIFFFNHSTTNARKLTTAAAFLDIYFLLLSAMPSLVTSTRHGKKLVDDLDYIYDKHKTNKDSSKQY